MDLHRHWKVRLYGPGLLLLSVVCFFSPQLLALVGYEFAFGNWVGYAMAAVSLLSGIVLTVDGLKAYALRVDAAGVIWTKGKRTAVFGWDDVTRIGIERKPNDRQNATPTVLTVWTRDTVNYPVDPDITLDGLRGYRVADVGELAEPASAVETALRRYAGHRYASAHPAG
ncbi:MAG: hypothetical protein ACRDT4_19290 [Micromonosporaceae bacterium]